MLSKDDLADLITTKVQRLLYEATEESGTAEIAGTIEFEMEEDSSAVHVTLHNGYNPYFVKNGYFKTFKKD